MLKQIITKRPGAYLTDVQRHYLRLTISAMLFTFGMQSFVAVTETFSSGLGAIASLLTYIIPRLSAYFSIIYLVLNIPTMIFSFKYNNKKFSYRTTYFLVAQFIVGLPFLFLPLHEIIAEHFWNFQSLTLLRQATWTLIVLPAVGSIFVGSAIGLAWKSGGSTAGFDVIAFYLSTKRKISIGKITQVLAFFIVSFSFAMKLIFVEDSRDTALPTLIGTGLFIYFNTVLIDKMFPKYSKVQLTVFANKATDIKKALKEDPKFKHSFNISKIETGMGVKRVMINTTVLLLEVDHIRRVIINADESAWIRVVSVEKVFGSFNTEIIDS